MSDNRQGATTDVVATALETGGPRSAKHHGQGTMGWQSWSSR